MAKPRFLRVAIEGGITDDRVIGRDWIDQKAHCYNPVTYTAGLNCAHQSQIAPPNFPTAPVDCAQFDLFKDVA